MSSAQLPSHISVSDRKFISPLNRLNEFFLLPPLFNQQLFVTEVFFLTRSRRILDSMPGHS